MLVASHSEKGNRENIAPTFNRFRVVRVERTENLGLNKAERVSHHGTLAHKLQATSRNCNHCLKKFSSSGVISNSNVTSVKRHSSNTVHQWTGPTMLSFNPNIRWRHKLYLSVTDYKPETLHQLRYGKISFPPGFDTRTVQLVASRYTDYAIPVQLYEEW
jgi:hypothetical protein